MKNNLTLKQIDDVFKKIGKGIVEPSSVLISPDVFYKMWKAKLLQMDRKLDVILELLEEKK